MMSCDRATLLGGARLFFALWLYLVVVFTYCPSAEGEQMITPCYPVLSVVDVTVRRFSVRENLHFAGQDGIVVLLRQSLHNDLVGIYVLGIRFNRSHRDNGELRPIDQFHRVDASRLGGIEPVIARINSGIYGRRPASVLEDSTYPERPVDLEDLDLCLSEAWFRKNVGYRQPSPLFHSYLTQSRLSILFRLSRRCLSQVQCLTGKVSEGDVDHEREASRGRYYDFSPRRWRSQLFSLGVFLYVLSASERCCGTFWLTSGIHYRNLRRILGSILVLFLSIFATWHSLGLMFAL
jgi:hypothetical protein